MPRLDRLLGLSKKHVPEVRLVKVTDIKPHPAQPRKTLNEQSIRSLANNIRQSGLSQPILVREERKEGAEPRYLLVTGQRRLKAFEHLDRDVIPAIVATSDTSDLELSVYENLQREELNPIDEADALARMRDEFGRTQEEIGKLIGKKQNTVSELLSIATLPESIKEEYRTSDKLQKTISKSQLIECAKISDKKEQGNFWDLLRSGKVPNVDAARRRREKPEDESTSLHPPALLSLTRAIARLGKVDPKELASDETYRTLVELREEIASLVAVIDERRGTTSLSAESQLAP